MSHLHVVICAKEEERASFAAAAARPSFAACAGGGARPHARRIRRRPRHFDHRPICILVRGGPAASDGAADLPRVTRASPGKCVRLGPRGLGKEVVCMRGLRGLRKCGV